MLVLYSVVPAIADAAAAATPPAAKPAEVLEENTGVVPADCVVLHGDAVVNEATLTGESVPQKPKMNKKGSDRSSRD